MTALSDLLNRLNTQEWSTREIERRSEKAGMKVSNGAVGKYLNGTHPSEPSDRVLRAFAAVFGTDVNKIRKAAGQAPTADRFELPPEADTLSLDERRAITELVRVMARQKKAGDGDVEATPMSEAGGKPAEEDGPTADELEDADRRQRDADETPLAEILGLAADAGESDAERRAREDTSPDH
ncbi:hypothetical protein CV023_15860 [Brevibacterium sp. CCUG 69071]|nr:hypothetical protein [Brevibacterium sp. CCUG 69071]